MSIVSFYQSSIFFFMYVLLLLFLASAVLARKHLTKPFTKISKRYWLILLAVFLLGLAIRSVYPHQHLLYIDEPWSMEAAKNMLRFRGPVMCEYVSMTNETCRVYPKVIGWPFLIAVAFQIFGISNWVALHFSSILGSFSVILIFLMGYLVFKKESAGLWAAFLLAIMPLHIVWSNTAETVVPSVFFALLTMLFFLIYFHTQRIQVLWVSFFSFALMLQMRGEFLLMILVVLGMFILFDGRMKKKLRDARFWASTSILIFALLIFVPQLMLLIGLQREIYAASYFQLSLILRNVLFGIKTVTLGLNLLFIFFLAVGAGICLLRHKKVFLYLLLWFSIFFTLLLSFVKLQDRMLLMPAMSLLLLTGFGIGSLGEFFRKRRALLLGLAVALIIVFLVQSYSALATYKPGYANKATVPGMSAYILETRIPELMEKRFENDCYIVTEWPTIFTSTTDFKAISTDTVTRNPNVVAEILESGSCVLYFEDGFCVKPPIAGSVDSLEGCREMHEKYYLGTYLELEEKNVMYTFYKASLKE